MILPHHGWQAVQVTNLYDTKHQHNLGLLLVLYRIDLVLLHIFLNVQVAFLCGIALQNVVD